MAAEQAVYGYRLRVRAFAFPSAGRRTELPICGAEITYALDSVPRAMLDLAVGADVHVDPETGRNVRVTALLAALTSLCPVQVWLRADPLSDGTPDDGSLPLGRYVRIFDGRCVRSSWRRDGEGAIQLSVECHGPIVALAALTQMTQAVHFDGAGGPLPFINVRLGEGALTPDGRQVLAHLEDLVFKGLGAGAASEDLWRSGLLPVFEEIAKQNPGAAAESETILRRINREGSRLETPPLRFLVPQDLPNPEGFRRALAASVNAGIYGAWAGGGGAGDLWDSLTLIRNEFLLHYVPTVDEDALVPIIGTLGGTDLPPWRTLTPADVRELLYSRRFNRTEYGEILTVGLYNARFEAADQFNFARKVAARVPEAGFYDLAGTSPDGSGRPSRIPGRRWIMPAPVWVLAPPPRAVNDADGSPEASDPRPGDAVEDRPVLSRQLANAYAKAWLHRQLYSANTAEVYGKLRLDICPGSRLAIVVEEDVFDRRAGRVPVPYYGMVLAVRVTLRVGEAYSYAGTDFSLGHVRRETEDRSTGIPDHPLFPGGKWTGAALTDFDAPLDQSLDLTPPS